MQAEKQLQPEVFFFWENRFWEEERIKQLTGVTPFEIV